MVAILEKNEHNVDFHPIVDFVEASPLRYALTFKPTVYVSHIQQFWSTARIETTEEGTKILATVDGILRTVIESSLRRNLKLQDEEGISSLPDTKLFKNLTLMGYNISPNQKFTFQKGQFSHQWKYLIHTIMQCLSPKSTGFNEFNRNISTALVCLATNRTYNFSKMIFDGLVKNVNNKVSKFLMYPRFLTMCLRMSQFGQITHTHTYVVPFHTRKLFTTLRVNSPSFSGRIVPLFDTMLVPQGKGSGTPTEPHHTPSPEAQHTSHTTHSSPTILSVTTAPIPPFTSSDTPPIRQYTRRARIAQSSVLLPVADEPASPLRDVSQGEACPTDSGFEADQDRATIAKTSTLPHDSAPRVTSHVAAEGTQELEINRLKVRVKLLEDKEGLVGERSRDDAPIKGRNLDEGEAAADRVSDDIEEMATILTSIDAATILAAGVADVPTGNDVVPTASPVFASVTVVTPYRRRKGKEIMVESETPKKNKVQEQIDAQVARDLEEELTREDQRMSEQVARDAEVERIHVEEEMQSMIDGLDRSNETVANYLQEYQQFASELPLERRIELISDLVRYQDNYAKVHKFQTQQRKSWSKKQKRDYYMAVIGSNLGWKLEDFISMGSKEEAERLKRKGLSLEKKNVKKLKTSEEVTKEAKSPDEVLEEKVKKMMQLVSIEEVVEKYKHNQDFHQIVDFVEASHIRYALTYNPTVYVSHIRQFWSTARIETTEEGTKILATVDGKLRTVSESSIRRNLKPNDEEDKPLFRQYTRRTRIAQSLVLPPIADEPASPLKDDSQGEAFLTDFGFETDQDRENIAKTSALPSDSTPRVTSLAADEGTQELEINSLKARIKLLEDKDREVADQSRDDAPIKGRRLGEGEEAAKRVSDNTEEMETVLTSMDATSIITSGGVQVVPTAAEVATATIDVQVARELEEEMSRDAQRMNEQIARDVEIVRIHAEQELQMLIDGLDRNNKTVAKYLPEFDQFAAELPFERRIELISDLVKYQDNYAKAKHFNKLEEIKEKFDLDWKQFQYFIPLSLKEEVERFKRKGLRLEQESVKKLKTSEELVPVEEVYVEDLQVKHPIIDWKVHTEGQRSYWKITRLGGRLTSYQFFVDMLKHLDREDLNQLWRLVKESLIIRPAVSDKEMELWVELKRLYEPNDEDQLWPHTQNLMHAPVEWKLYDMCRVHYVTSKDKEIFMLMEKDYPLRKGLAIIMICYKL
nr:hypothetical protein [Tanacetum cinerariifolium]